VPVYGVSTVAFGGELRVSVALAVETTSATGPVVVASGLLESVALTVTLAVPAVVGVPLTKQPVAMRPAGRVLAVMVHE